MSYNHLLKKIERTFKKNPNKVAIYYNDIVITYKELAERVDKCIDEIVGLKSNIRYKTKVLLSINNPIQFIIIWLSLWKLDCIIIPFQPKGQNSAELKRAIEASECNIVIKESDINIDDINVISVEKSKNFSSLVYVEVNRDIIDDKYNDLSVFFYTSGTTGLPKCVGFTEESMLENIKSVAEVIDLSEIDVFFTPLSPVLTATITTAVLPSLYVGASLVITNCVLPANILKNIEEKKVTIFFAVPYIYELLNSTMNLHKLDVWNSVRICLTSSAFLKKSTFDEFYEKTSIPMRSIYCSSEAGAITYNNSNDIKLIRNSVGLPLPGVKVKIFDGKMNELKQNQVGELYIGGSHLASGYYNKLELGKKVFKNNLVRTGDIGFINEKGFIVLKGRASDTINVSGFLVNPEEIEQVIIRHHDVKDALVYGINDDKTGERVAAKIILKDEACKLAEDDIYNFCIKQLEQYKIPRHIEIVDDIPKSRYGKKIRVKRELN
ncbi:MULTISPECIES: class I adenylate-forming enzyme family protein [Clostridium]|uniref:class I adenylate-forming enzyme family protein n=1 Tax=Clostridium TaxID=1485 RepID=UPI000826847C|nr:MULTISPECIES: class I adenylate-forming enzyme family protein [Clostridium]PJI06516.1 long-chain fatty acid--CoA ligase [Clostridium sp. CT7]